MKNYNKSILLSSRIESDLRSCMRWSSDTTIYYYYYLGTCNDDAEVCERLKFEWFGNDLCSLLKFMHNTNVEYFDIHATSHKSKESLYAAMIEDVKFYNECDEFFKNEKNFSKIKEREKVFFSYKEKDNSTWIGDFDYHTKTPICCSDDLLELWNMQKD